MGVKKFFQEVKTKVSPSRLFKALVTDSHNTVPKFTPSVKSLEVVGGSGFTAGCHLKSTITDGAHLKYVTHRIDHVDHDNYVCKYTLIEGDVIGDKLEKVCYEMKFEASEDGGCLIKLDCEYHTKGDVEISEDEIKAGKAKALGLYKACEEYLIAHPDACV